MTGLRHDKLATRQGKTKTIHMRIPGEQVNTLG